MFLRIVSVLLILFHLTIAVPLDGACSNDNRCDGVGTICKSDRCQCDEPWYRPCNITCVPVPNIVYEGDECRTPDNCVGNTLCIEGKCACRENNTPRNGLCFKKLNDTCTNNTECWSFYCADSRCSCGSGFVPDDNGIGCHRKLVKVYSNIGEAIQADALCLDESTCITALAVCVSGGGNSTSKFCKCREGYRIISNNEECELITSSQLSPLSSVPGTYEDCGTCNDENAACMKADSKTTCWCRAGYQKENDKCVKVPRRELVIFPNSIDSSTHDFTSACKDDFNGTVQTQGDLCTCRSGYKYDSRDRPCKKIQPEWIDSMLEYGLCTRITSKASALSEPALCPGPLTCRAKVDKYVCSCGANQFRDIDDPSKCVYFIGKNASETNGVCPTQHAIKAANGICECQPGFRATNLDRRCEVELVEQPFEATCNQNQSLDIACAEFGRGARLCSPGECRCVPNENYANMQGKRCNVLINRTLSQLSQLDCPSNARIDNNRCICNDGYRAAADLKSCVRVVATLIEHAGPAQPNSANGWKDADCRALYTGPVMLLSEGRCQCRNLSFINTDNTGCWYQLDVNLPEQPIQEDCPPTYSRIENRVCRCDPGYKSNGKICVPITDRVYISGDPNAVNMSTLTDEGCKKLFGLGSRLINPGAYCTCRPEAYITQNNAYCIFYINATGPATLGISDCPANAIVEDKAGRKSCVCRPGYNADSTARACVVRNVELIGIESPSSSNCDDQMTAACKVRYGEYAFCRNNSCFCDQGKSYINGDRQCEPFSKFIYPAIHERQDFSCTSKDDCGDDENVECDYISEGMQYQVCKCVEGAYLDTSSKKCVKQRCAPACNSNANFECNGYTCVCKKGFYLRNGVCIPVTNKLELNRPCNNSEVWRPAFINDENLVCDTACERARCAAGYRSDDDKCVAYEFDDTRCFYQEGICTQIDSNSFCDRAENHCSCRTGYYEFDGKCARAVNSVCVRDEECGGNMLCENRRCSCNKDQRTEHTVDVYGRTMTKCINNAVGRIQSSLMMFISLICVWLYLL